MDTSKWPKFRKVETILLGLVLYSILLVYTYQYLHIENKYLISSPDEIFYYIEAKAISAHNIYQTPLSLDGNTSFIGDFGSHGISYAIIDGWLAKLFFHAQDPPMIWINFLTCLSMLALILLFKPFSLNTRLKIALVVATHYVLYTYTISYIQETIQFLFAVLALGVLYRLYEQKNPATSNYLYYYLIVIIIAITFRYSWFIWGLGLLPLASHFKKLTKWILVLIGLMAFAIFIGRYIYAPYPYEEIVAYRIIRTENLSIFDSLIIVWQKFMQNLQLFLTPNARFATTCMRYLLLVLLITNTWFAVMKRNRFTIACTLIGWGYLFSCLAFYFLVAKADERVLAILNPLLAFSLIGACNSFIFYPVIAIQLLLFPGVVETRNQSYLSFVSAKAALDEKFSREASYSKIKDLINDDHSVVVSLPIKLTWHRRPNYLVDFPLVTKKGHPIHYTMLVDGNDLRKIHHPQYKIASHPIDDARYQLIYSDNWMHFYRILY